MSARSNWRIAPWLGVALCAVATSSAPAQSALLPNTRWSLGTQLQGWYLTEPLPQAQGRLQAIAQGAVPMAMGVRVRGWQMDASAAYAYGAAALVAPEGSDGDPTFATVSGLTDVRLRATGPLFTDHWRLTVGVNIPTGRTQFTANQTTATQLLAAPALGMPVVAYGTGAGVTAGVLRAFAGDNWAVALGSSYEKRSRYTPVALALGGGTLETQVAPGSAIHLTAGFDRTLTAARWSGLVVTDLYTEDLVEVTGGTTPVPPVGYTLGPQITANTQLDFSGAHWRERTVSLTVRHRTTFADSSGTAVPGSAGSYVDASIATVRGGPLGAGFVFGADAHWQSGLSFTDALVGAAATGAGLTLGVDVSGRHRATRTALHLQYGSFDTGRQKSTGVAVSLGLHVASQGAR